MVAIAVVLRWTVGSSWLCRCRWQSFSRIVVQLPQSESGCFWDLSSWIHLHPLSLFYLKDFPTYYCASLQRLQSRLSASWFIPTEPLPRHWFVVTSRTFCNLRHHSRARTQREHLESGRIFEHNHVVVRQKPFWYGLCRMGVRRNIFDNSVVTCNFPVVQICPRSSAGCREGGRWYKCYLLIVIIMDSIPDAGNMARSFHCCLLR